MGKSQLARAETGKLKALLLVLAIALLLLGGVFAAWRPIRQFLLFRTMLSNQEVDVTNDPKERGGISPEKDYLIPQDYYLERGIEGLCLKKPIAAEDGSSARGQQARPRSRADYEANPSYWPDI